MEKIDLNNPVWKNLVLKKSQVNLNFLAGKILLSRLQLNLRPSSPEHEINKAINDLFDLYYKSKDLPNAKKDISLLLNK
jgi:hypothetical protein